VKASAEALIPALSVPIGRSRWAVLKDLFKARLTALVILTTAMGFHLANRGPTDWLLFFHAVLGTALLAAGAAALNEYIERDLDARMPRTAKRPLPAGELQPDTALALGVGTAVLGMLDLAWFVNPLTAFLGMVTLASYVFVYTPLKTVTTLNTLVGAVPGAVPPLMGWAAATNSLDAGGWVLFAILFHNLYIKKGSSKPISTGCPDIANSMNVSDSAGFFHDEKPTDQKAETKKQK